MRLVSFCAACEKRRPWADRGTTYWRRSGGRVGVTCARKSQQRAQRCAARLNKLCMRLRHACVRRQRFKKKTRYTSECLSQFFLVPTPSQICFVVKSGCSSLSVLSVLIGESAPNCSALGPSMCLANSQSHSLHSQR